MAVRRALEASEGWLHGAGGNDVRVRNEFSQQKGWPQIGHNHHRRKTGPATEAQPRDGLATRIGGNGKLQRQAQQAGITEASQGVTVAGLEHKPQQAGVKAEIGEEPSNRGRFSARQKMAGAWKQERH